MTIFMGDISDPGTLRIDEEVVAFYIGGNTPHVWTQQQIEMQTARYRHPVWVYDPARPGTDNGIIDGHKAVAQLQALKVPTGVAVSLDMETHEDAAYVDGARSVIASTGYWTSVYGSLDFIRANPRWGGGYWVADWITPPPSQAQLPSGTWACQYQQATSEIPWDISAVFDTSHLWDVEGITPAHAVLVEIPSGNTRVVSSLNGGSTWS